MLQRTVLKAYSAETITEFLYKNLCTKISKEAVFVNDKTKKRSKIIQVRITEDEQEQIKELQRIYEMNESELIRWAIFNKSVLLKAEIQKTDDTRNKLLIQLGEIGNNLNQIARHLNSTAAVTPGLIDNLKTQMDSLHDIQVNLSRENAISAEEKKTKTIYLKG
jgi:Mg2+ and Co2+ transporter CorA